MHLEITEPVWQVLRSDYMVQPGRFGRELTVNTCHRDEFIALRDRCLGFRKCPERHSLKKSNQESLEISIEIVGGK